MAERWGAQWEAVQRFAALMALPPGDVDLGIGAFLIAEAGDPGVDLKPWQGQLDLWADGVADLDGLRQRLFGELGLRGATSDYYDPDNSFLHRVMARRVGIPITLSVLAIEVGWRAGVPLEGVGMPGHFLVRVPHSGVYLDPFAGGAILTEAGCEARFRESTGAGAEVAFGPHLLPSVGPHAILGRMLANLASIYQLRRSGKDLEWVARMQLSLPGAGTDEALLLASAIELQGRFLDAARELELRAQARPELAPQLTPAANALRARFN